MRFAGFLSCISQCVNQLEVRCVYVPSSLVLEGLVLSSLTWTCMDPPPACSPAARQEKKYWVKKNWTRWRNRSGCYKKPPHAHLRLHLASFSNINIDYIHLLPGLSIQTVRLKQNQRPQLDTGRTICRQLTATRIKPLHGWHISLIGEFGICKNLWVMIIFSRNMSQCNYGRW